MLIAYTISSNPVTQATQITQIVADYANEPHNNIIQLTFGTNVLTGKLPMLDDTHTKRYKYRIRRSNRSGVHFKSNYTLVTNTVTDIVTILVAAITTFI